jgi:hypothetical protein
MNVSKEEAQASLSSIRNVMIQTHKSIASSYANPSLILWGILWIIAFTSTHFFVSHAFEIFLAMTAAGGAGTAVIFIIFRSKAPVRETTQKIGWRITAFWIFLGVFIAIWLFILAPFNGMQCNAFICTEVMFAYIVMGLWFESHFMIILGAALTTATLVGFYILTEYYWLWMALIGGGGIFGTGLYIRLRWR